MTIFPDEFVTAFLGKREDGRQNADYGHAEYGPADGAEGPADIQPPANEETAVMVVEVCLCRDGISMSLATFDQHEQTEKYVE